MHDPYATRRARVLSTIHPGVLILPAAPTVLRNGDTCFEYRQDSDFYYLTGFEEPGAVLVLTSPSDQPFTLFVRPRDPEREVWDGLRAGVEGAVKDFGANQAWSVDEVRQRLLELLKNRSRLFYRLGRDRVLDEAVVATIAQLRTQARKGVWWPSELIDPEQVLHEHRHLKSPAETQTIRRAVAITAEAVRLAMAETRPGLHEYEIEGLVRGVFRRLGAQRTSFEPIVASGPNATVLHYRNNERMLQANELLLLVIGCEYRFYAADVTRTFPVSGTFTRTQADLYGLVLRAQAEAIATVRPGATLEQVHQAALRVINDGLVERGLVSGPTSEALEQERYKPFFMHRTSHYLGMDVHDVGRYYDEGVPRALQAGMVITVEPGVYVRESAEVAPEYRGLGIRIEDDVMVSEDGHVVLSAEIPKSIHELEQACRR
jgi:Xaa-Pro aminopeptidase